MSLDGVNGFLDVESAALRAPQVGIANTNPQHILSVGSNLYVSGDSSDVLTVDGNVVCEGVKVGLIEITPSYDFAAVSNVGNTTSNIIQFANATTGFVTTANVEIGGNITLTANAQVKVGSNVLAEYTGPHPREPKEVPLKKYPEVGFDESKFDHNTTTNTFTQAGYTITSSSNFGGDDANSQYTAWRSFTGLTNGYGPGWTSGGGGAHPSAYTNGVANSNQSLTNIDTATSTGGVSSRNGAWIKLELPTKIKLGRIDFYDRYGGGGNERVSEAFVYGGNSNSGPWYELGKQSDATNMAHYTDDSPASLSIDTSTYYKYYIIQPTAQENLSRVYVSYGQLMFYGTEEPAPPGDLSLDTTIKSTFNSVRSNNYVMYFDGEDPTGNPVVPKYLPSGTVKTITPNNITFDASNNCWSLDGSTESNVTTGSLGLVGDAPHTVSTWINASNLEANALTQQLFSIGSGYSEEIVRVDDTQIAANTWHNVTYAYQGEGGSKVTYVDGRKVEEEKVEDTFGKYPPFAMTDHETGGFRASASNEDAVDTYFAWKAFDNGTGSAPLVGWFSDQIGNYNGTNGAFTTSSTVRLAPETEKGEWLQLEFPYFFHLDSFTIFSQNDSQTIHTVDNLIVYAKKGLSDTWTSLGTFTGIASRQSASGVSEAVNANEMYKYFAIVVTKRYAQHSTDGVTIRELKYYGHKEGDLTRFPEPTRVLEYPHIAVGVPQDTPAKRGYVVTTGTSIFSGRTGARAFDDQPTGDGWETDNGAFSDQVNQTGGDTFTNLGSGGGSFTGHWIQLEMPHKLKFTGHIEINAYVNGTTDDRRPDAGAFLGSNDGSNWYLLHEFTSGSLNWVSLGGTTNQAKITTLSASNTNAYKYVVMVITKKSDVGTSTVTKTSIRRLRYYGTQEDTGTPAIVGGPFAGKVANFRVYDQYLGDERIQEIYDAQKDAFGHKKSSMTLYKGRVGVGTTEPEGALTVLDEPHALAKFPARAVSADDSHVEGDGQIKLSAVDGSGYQAFDGLTSTSWTAAPTRNTRLSEEVDFGAWLKIQTPESVSLKKAEIESNPYWQQLGSRIDGSQANARLGASMALSDDGTRLVAGAWNLVGTNNSGAVYVYDWNGSAWTQVGSVIGHHTVSGSRNGWAVSISGDGNTVAVGSRVDSPGTDSGSVTSFTLVGATWTLKGAVIATGLTGDRTGYALSRMSTDGNIVAFSDYLYDKQSSETDLGGVSGNSHTNAGRVRVFKYENGSWSQRGSSLIGENASDSLGFRVQMSEDGKYLIFSSQAGSKVYIFEWNGTTYVQRGSTLTGVAGDQFGESVDISKDGSIVAVGYRAADAAEGAAADDNGLVQMYKWDSTNNSYTLTQKLRHISADASDRFGSSVSLSSDGKRLIVGADLDDTGGTDSGIAYVFESYDGSSWFVRHPYTSMSHTSSAGAAMVGHRSSLYVSRDGSTIGVGEPKNNTNGSDAGAWNAFSMPSNIKSIWGSNDDVNWTKITTGNETFRVTDRLEFKNLDNPNYYKYHAIVADAFTRLKDIKLYGIRNQGSSTLHDGTLTLTKKVTAPQLESTGIINMKGDYTEIRANSNVVTEFNRSKKLIKYPRVAMTQNDESGTSGYVASASTVLSSDWEPYEAFNTIAGEEDGWHDVGSTYSTGVYTGSNSVTPVTGVDVEGEWIQIQLPEKIKLEKVRLAPRSVYSGRMPKDATILGSINGTDWYIVTSWSGQTYMSGNNYTTINVDSEQYYNYYVLVVEALGADSSGNSVNIGEWELFGTPEYDPEAHGVDVVVKSVPNVPNTDWLEVYYDGQDYTQMPTTVTDKSGNNRTGTPSGGVGFDTEYKAFTFDGVNDYVTSTTLSSHFAGDPTVTYACWVKFNAMTTGQMFLTINAPGVYTPGVIGGLYLGTDGTIYNTVGNRGIQASEKLVTNRWYHLVATKIPGNTGTDTQKLYIDGVYVSQFPWNTSGNQVIGSNPVLRIGAAGNGNDRLNGYMANVRLFNRALTSDEIWQLYAYQKEYFGHGDLGMTLKAGRLGIGTSEPQAALDVRGDAIVDGSFQCGNSPLKFFVLNGQFPTTGTTQDVTDLPSDLISRIYNVVSMSGLTIDSNGDQTNWIRHGSTSWEVDIKIDVSVPKFLLSGFDATSVNISGKYWRMFVVTT